MPQIFKALTSITVWILFIFGCLSLLGGFARAFGASVGMDSPELSLVSAYFGYGIVSLFLSVIAVKIRRGLE
jgi:high-affinity nickel permease